MLVDSDLLEGTDEKTQQAAREAASALLRLPWELLHDGRGYLFQGKHAVRVRRRLPNRHEQEAAVTARTRSMPASNFPCAGYLLKCKRR